MTVPTSQRYQTLLNAIEHMLLRVRRQDTSHFIMSQAGHEQMRQRPLPKHATITPRQVGLRIVQRSSHHINYRQAVTALYPEDGMDEVVYAAFTFVLEGQADLRVGDYVLGSAPGDIIFLPPRIPKANSRFAHLEGDVAGRSCALLWIAPSLYADGLRFFICRSHEALHLRTQPDEECTLRSVLLKNLFEELALEMEENGPSAIARQLLETLLCLARHYIEQNKAVSSFGFRHPLEAKVEEQHPIEFACDYIDANLHCHLTLAEVARHCYLSPSAFTKRFRQHTGQSFVEYLTQQRMQTAKRLLEETDWNIALVCHTIGLKESRFRQLFLQHYGQSPMNFRKALLRKN